MSEKIGDPLRDGVVRLNFECFSDPEKTLYRDIWEEHGDRLPAEVLEANKEFILKTNEITFRYVINDLRFTLLCFFGNLENEINKWHFNLHFTTSLPTYAKPLGE